MRRWINYAVFSSPSFHNWNRQRSTANQRWKYYPYDGCGRNVWWPQSSQNPVSELDWLSPLQPHPTPRYGQGGGPSQGSGVGPCWGQDTERRMKSSQQAGKPQKQRKRGRRWVKALLRGWREDRSNVLMILLLPLLVEAPSLRTHTQR